MVKTDLNYSKIYQTCPADTYLGTILTEEVNLISKRYVAFVRSLHLACQDNQISNKLIIFVQ